MVHLASQHGTVHVVELRLMTLVGEQKYLGEGDVSYTVGFVAEHQQFLS